MADSNAQRVDEPAAEPQEPFSNKPVMLADTGHGTKVKLWTQQEQG